MSEINLLTNSAKVDKQTQKSVALLTRIAIVAGVIVMLEALVGGILLFVLNSNLGQAKTKYDQVLAAVKDLEATEINLVLIKDRLAKIQPILDSRGAYTALDRYNQIINSLPPDAVFEALEVRPDGSKLTLISNNSDSLGSIISFLEDPSKYQVAILDEVNFDNIQGFEIVITTN